MQKRKVLVVDNSPVVLKLVSSIIEKENCEVVTADDGLSALDILKHFQPDIIFTDMVMPNISGDKFCSIIRNTVKWQNIFLVVISGIALEDQDTILDLDADVCIAKSSATSMKSSILKALAQYDQGERKDQEIHGMGNLYSREITRELLSIKHHYDIVFESMGEGVVELDSKGRIITANQAALHFLMQTDEVLLGGNFVDYLPLQAQLKISHWLKNLHFDNVQPLIFDDKSTVWLFGRQVTLNLTPVIESESFFIVGIMKDITARKKAEEKQLRLEQQLHQVEKLEAMSRMAGGISHDFNNLLAILHGYLEMAMMEAEPGGSMKGSLDGAYQALEKTMQLVTKFNSLSEGYEPSKSTVSVEQLLDELSQYLLQDSEVTFNVSSEDDLWEVDADDHQLSLVLGNVLQNAYDAMDGAGDINVTLSNINGSDEQKRVNHPIPDGRLLRISVRDSGPGINADILDRIFDPYFSTKQQGTQKGMGLGMTIVYSIVKKHGGYVWMEAPTPGGSVVHLYFPAEMPLQDQEKKKSRDFIKQSRISWFMS